jgi:hypothetical protein
LTEHGWNLFNPDFELTKDVQISQVVDDLVLLIFINIRPHIFSRIVNANSIIGLVRLEEVTEVKPKDYYMEARF